MPFRSYHILFVCILAVFLSATASCGSSPLPTPTPTEEIKSTATEITATTTPIPPTTTPTPTPTSTPSLTQDGLHYVHLGQDKGDIYSPVALAVDAELQRIYIYGSHNNEDGQDTLTVVQSNTGNVIDTVRLGGNQTIPSLASQLLVDPKAHRVYALNGDSTALLILDGDTLDILFIIHGATRVALAPDQNRVYLINEIGQIKLLSASDYGSIESLDWEGNFEPSYMAYNAANDGLYLARWDFAYQGSIVVLDGTTLQQRAEIPLPSAPHALQIAPNHNEIFVATDTGITIISGETDRILENVDLQISSFNPSRSMTLAPDKDRLYLGYNWGLSLASGGGLIILGTETRMLEERIHTQHFWQDMLFVPEEDRLYAIPAHNESLLTVNQMGKVEGRAMLGLRLLDMQTDPATGHLWSVDSAGTLHVMGNPPALEDIDNRESIIGTVDGAVEQADLILTENGAYLTDEAQGRTISIDTQDREIHQKFLTAGPAAADTQGQRLFVVDENIEIYGLGSGKPVSEIAIPHGEDAPNAIDIIYEATNDRVYLKMRNDVNSSVNYRTYWRVYDGKTGRYLTAFNPDKRDIVGIEIVPKANRLYLTYAGASDWDHGLVTYDLGGVELDRVKGLGGQILSSSDGNYLYVLRQSGLWALGSKTLKLVALWPLTEAYEQLALDSANKWLYLRRDSRIATISIQELLQKGIQSPRQLPESLGLPASTYRSPQYEKDATVYAIVPGEGVYRSKDGGETWLLSIEGLKDLYVSELTFSETFDTDGTIWITTTSRSTYTSSDRGETWRRSTAWTPAISFESLRDDKSGIFLMNSDASQVRALTENGINARNPDWDPEGNWICFDSDHEGNSGIYVIQSDGYGLVQLTDDPADDTEAVWSPGGGRIAFVSTRSGNQELYTMEADGANLKRITDNPAADRQPVWSPDGNQLAFTSDRDGQDEIYVLTLENGEARRLTTSDSQDHEPAWSPDNQWIAFVSDRHGDSDVFLVHPDGSGLTQITQAAAAEEHPAWSPDSGSLVFSSDRTGIAQLYRMDRSGGNWLRLTMDTYASTNPAWVRQ